MHADEAQKMPIAKPALKLTWSVFHFSDVVEAPDVVLAVGRLYM
jgi:hypothetical protein